eukprot:scpid102798/ scgid14853/ 
MQNLSSVEWSALIVDVLATSFVQWWQVKFGVLNRTRPGPRSSSVTAIYTSLFHAVGVLSSEQSLYLYGTSDLFHLHVCTCTVSSLTVMVIFDVLLSVTSQSLVILCYAVYQSLPW